MNAINQKTISISIFKLVLPLFVLLFIQIAAIAQTFQLSGTWTMFNDKNVKFDKPATITQSGANLSINNGYGSNSTAILNGNTFKTSDGLTGTVSADGTRINWSIGYVWVKQGANNQPNKIEGETQLTPEPIKDATVSDSTSNKVVRDTNNTNAQNYTQAEQNCFDMVQNKVAYDQLGTTAWNDDNIRKLCKGTTDPAATISCFKNIISSYNDWNRGITECAGTQTPTDSGKITRTITIKNNSGIILSGNLINLSGYALRNNNGDVVKAVAVTKTIVYSQTETFGGSNSFPLSEDVEMWINADNYKPLFKAKLPKNKDITTFCYEVTGTSYIPVIKTCDGTPTYEAKYIAFKNESAFVADMRLTYYPLGGSTTKTAATDATLLGYSRKLYLPLDADTNRKMTFTVNMVAGSLAQKLISKDVSLSDFDTVGSSCYKTWGAGMNPKASPCSLNPNARKIKFWNNAGYGASLLITYYDKDNAGKDVAKTVNTNDIEVTQTDTIEVPNGTSLTPIKIEFRNKWNGNKTFSTMNASANFTGELCYKVEGTTLAPTAATCDDTVGDTSGNTRQIRFQNDAGYDAEMIVTYFMDEVINGNKIPMMKTLTTGLINGLGGKFRLVTIPKNTSKGMPITIWLKGNATFKNDIFSIILPADFAASPQPCFKVWGWLFEPQGGKCNQ